jgi:hypothetical protein
MASSETRCAVSVRASGRGGDAFTRCFGTDGIADGINAPRFQRMGNFDSQRHVLARAEMVHNIVDQDQVVSICYQIVGERVACHLLDPAGFVVSFRNGAGAFDGTG